MTIRQLALLVFVVFGGACAAPTYQLDHFKVYEVAPLDLDAPVELTGQFDEGKPRPALVRVLTHFANPVAKRHDTDNPIVDKSAHLTWYKIDEPEPEPLRTVRYQNQFGGPFSIDIGRAVYLLVPAENLAPGGTFPEDLDHYKCYEVVHVNTVGPRPTVVLTDEFGQQQTRLGAPRYFCVPVRKHNKNAAAEYRRNRKRGLHHQGREDEDAEIQHPDDHLVVYEIEPKRERREIKVRDQFGSWPLVVRRSVALCVPSEKLDWAPRR